MQDDSTTLEGNSQASANAPQDESASNPVADLDLIDAAVWWTDLGIAVFPLHHTVDGVCTCPDGPTCDSPGKHPRVAGGVKAATTEIAQVLDWWGRWPRANIGLATGNGLHVIDIDSDEGETNLEVWDLPPTTEVSTGKGRHLYFIEPIGFTAGNTQGSKGKRHLGEGIDTRGRGGYVVGAPSVHASGHVYELVHREFAELPEPVTQRLQSSAADREAPMDVEHRARTPLADMQFATMLTVCCERIGNASKGTRHKRVLNGIREVAGHYHMQSAMTAAEVLNYVDESINRAYPSDRGRAGGYRTARDAWRDGLAAPYPHMPGELQHTPDGRPYVVAVDGSRGMYVATQGPDGSGGEGGAFVYQDSTLVVPRLKREWPGLHVWVPKVSGDGNRPMSSIEALERYGDAWCDRIEYAYEGKSEFVEETGVLRIVTRFRPPPVAVKHDDIETWLQILPANPNDVDVLLDWLATFPLISLPTAALVLTGPKSVGKGLMVAGLCAYFGVSPISYDVAVSRFNAQLRLTPVVWLDEATRAHGKSAYFRRLVANTVHPIEGKNRPTATLHGSPRSLTFGNNDDPYGLAEEDLSASDEEAIGMRLRHIPVSADAAAYLEGIGGREATERDDWPGKLAEHVAWLHTTRQVNGGGRLLVAGDAARWAREVGARQGLAGQILQLVTDEWLSTDVTRQSLQLRKPNGAPTPSVLKCLEPGGPVVFVTNEGIRAAWGQHFSESPPSHVAVNKALKRLSRVSKPRQVSVSGRRFRVFPVPVGLLDLGDVLEVD